MTACHAKLTLQLLMAAMDTLGPVQVTQQAMAFMVEHTTGIICTAMPPADLDRLELPLMVPTQENDEAMRTAFTVTVDARCLTCMPALSHCTPTLLHVLAQQQVRAAPVREAGQCDVS